MWFVGVDRDFYPSFEYYDTEEEAISQYKWAIKYYKEEAAQDVKVTWGEIRETTDLEFE